MVAGVLIKSGAQFKFSDVGSGTNFPSVLADETGNADADDGVIVGDDDMETPFDATLCMAIRDFPAKVCRYR